MPVTPRKTVSGSREVASGKKKKPPKMAASKPAAILRLERGEDAERVFWEIKRTKAEVTIRFGRYLNAGRTTVRSYANNSAAVKAFEEAVLGKRSEGYAERAPRGAVVIGSSAKTGVSARNPEMEALIDECPTDAQRYLVYADWLQQEGDPRGELIMVHHKLVTNTDSRELSKLDDIEAKLMSEFEADLLGPLVKYTRLRTRWGDSFPGLAWRYGFIRAARAQTSPKASEIISDVLDHPSGRFIERLVVEPGARDVNAVFTALEGSAPKTLSSFLIGSDSYAPMRGPNAMTIERVWTALPHLRQLILASGSIANLGSGSAPDTLEELHVVYGTPDNVLPAIAKLHWPKLKRLHLTVAAGGEKLLAPIFAQMPALEHVTVRRWVMGNRGPAPDDALLSEAASVASGYCIGKRLSSLSLEIPASKPGVQALLASAQKLGAIASVRIPKRAVVDPDTRAALRSQVPGLEWTAPPEEEDFVSMETFHHQG